VVCSNALNRTVKEFGITEPNKILDKTRELVLETFAKSESDIKDGMDISLCSLNTKTNELLWSGANNPLWYVSANNLNEIKGDKQPIGKTDDPKPFTTHKIELQKGDTIYIFTDGYADQFGGEKAKKFIIGNTPTTPC
jgi:serine phosphatase RsbU (regulator of sigma subunit)